MRNLASNQELYDYLVSLGGVLAQRGADQLAEKVRTATRHAAGLSAEFLGESGIALRNVLDSAEDVLNFDELDELRGVISQIEAAFRR